MNHKSEDYIMNKCSRLLSGMLFWVAVDNYPQSMGFFRTECWSSRNHVFPRRLEE